MTEADVPVIAVVIAGAVGGVIGPVLATIAWRFLRSERPFSWRTSAAAAVATGVASVVITAAIGFRPPLLAYVVFVVATIIIPKVVVLPASGAVLVLLAASALLDGEWPRVLGAVIDAAVLFALYVVLAFISPRGMGMGASNSPSWLAP